VVRIQIRLTKEQYLQLKQLASRRGIPLASLIREGLEHMLKEAREPDLGETRHSALSVLGKYHSGRKDGSTHHDQYLNESYKS